MEGISEDIITDIVHEYIVNNLTLSVKEVEEIGSADRVGDRKKFKIELRLRHTLLADEIFTI